MPRAANFLTDGSSREVDLRLAGIAWRNLRLARDRHPAPKQGRSSTITRRQALRNSTFALGGAVLAPQLAKAEAAA